ncbi:MAG TPA: cation:proton antiporter [Solirubrobacterales bacterium]|jgi:NhaP-type Na+/H+ or K+/H+ antiporter
MDIGFGDAILLFGGLLAVSAALSGVMRGTVLSISVLSVALGIALAEAGVVSVDAGDKAIVHLVELALIVTLFSDGMFVERELLRTHWGPVVRAIVVAMPITLGLLALVGKALFNDLTWAEAFLLAAVLTPTDPVVTSSVVTSQRVPSSIRHMLNLESGLNDGLALPFVLFFLVLAAPGGNAGHEGVKVLGEAAFGALVGVVLGLVGGRLHHHLPGGGLTPRYEGIYALGFGLVAFGLADVTIGNGLVAAFVAGIAMGAAERDVPDAFLDFAENVSAILQVITFFVFGALIVATGYHGEIWRLVLFIPFVLLVARPAAIWLSFLRERIPGPHKLFVAWFGPKGVASMLFALFVLDSDVIGRSLIFDVAAFTILASIVAHGLTDTVGARWVERRMR